MAANKVTAVHGKRWEQIPSYDLGAVRLGLGGSFLLELAFLLCASDRSGEKLLPKAAVFSPDRQSPPAHLAACGGVHRPDDRSSRRIPNRAIFATLSRKRFPLRMLEGEGTATSPYAVGAALAGAEDMPASAATLPYVCLGMP
jgi:hypothetical protein